MLDERFEPAVDPIEPMVQHADAGGPGTELTCPEHPREQVRLDAVVVLENPEGLEQVVLVVGIGRVEPRDPRAHGLHDGLGRLAR